MSTDFINEQQSIEIKHFIYQFMSLEKLRKHKSSAFVFIYSGIWNLFCKILKLTYFLWGSDRCPSCDIQAYNSWHAGHIFSSSPTVFIEYVDLAGLKSNNSMDSDNTSRPAAQQKLYIIVVFKGIVHPKMKMLWLFTHVIPNL